MTGVVVFLCLYGALAFFCLGLVAAKAELLEEPQPIWHYARCLLAPWFVVSEVKSFGRVRLNIREEHRADLLTVVKRRLWEYRHGDLREHMVYVLRLLEDGDDTTQRWFLSQEWTAVIVAARVRGASIPDTADLVSFVAYMGAAAGMSEREVEHLIKRLEKSYQNRWRLPSSKALLN